MSLVEEKKNVFKGDFDQAMLYHLMSPVAFVHVDPVSYINDHASLQQVYQ